MYKQVIIWIEKDDRGSIRNCSLRAGHYNTIQVSEAIHDQQGLLAATYNPLSLIPLTASVEDQIYIWA